MKKKIFLLLFFCLFLPGCATPPTDPAALADYKAQNDPLEPMNRKILAFNNKADEYVLHPISEGYRAVTTPDFRKGVRNFVGNLKTPLTVVNDVLQFNMTNAGKDLSRFVINSTLGFFGVFDVAAQMGINPNWQGFGTTMAVWGVPDGPYLILPLLGPSNVRDTTGLGADFFLDPLTHVGANTGSDTLKNSIIAIDIIGPLSAYEYAMDLLSDAQKTSLDYYAYVRSMYRQHRQKTIDDAKGIDLKQQKASYEFSLDDEDL